MDALVGLVDGVRARGAFVLRLSLDPPWSMRIQDGALTLICQTRGTAVITTTSGATFALAAGDVALARGSEHYVFCDANRSEPQVVVHPGQRCTTVAGRDLRFDMTVGVRTWGNSADGADAAVIGAYEGTSAVSARLLDALPPVLVLSAAELDTPLVALLSGEAGRDRAGQAVYLDRLLDLLLVDVLRTWFATADAPPWWRAESDELVGPALRLIYDAPAHPWTVAELAAAVGSSRAVFARRFRQLIGQPPIAFLAEWRLALATDLLHTGDRTLAAVARQVGYASPFAFSTAFKRARGMSPAVYRRTVVDMK